MSLERASAGMRRSVADLVTSARVVCASQPRVSALTHVRALVAAFLAPPGSWTANRAVRSGCTHLALHILDAITSDTELHFATKRLRAQWVLYEAAAVGDVAFLEHLVTRFGCFPDDWSVTKAVAGGHFDAVQWLFDHAVSRLPPDEDAQAFTRMIFPSQRVVSAAGSGNLDMLQWIDHVVGGLDMDLVLQGAAEHGHLHVVEWACPTATTSLTDYPFLQAVARGGNLDVAKLLHSKSVLKLSSQTMDAVAEHGQLEMLQWMYDSGGDGCSYRAIDRAAGNGHLDVVQWLHAKGLDCSTRAMDNAAWHGHLEVIRFLHENRSEGCSPSAFTHALWFNHLEVAQYLHAHRREDCSEATINTVANNPGNLEMLQWLETNYPDAECSTIVMDCAAKNGHIDVVQYLDANRTEGCSSLAMDQAAKNGHLDVVKWLHFHRTEGCTNWAMDKAAKKGHLEIVKFLHVHRTEGCTTDAMDHADSLEILQWLSENRREGFTREALVNAVSIGDMEMFLWLSERADADMWTSWLATVAVFNVRIEMLEWLEEHHPALIDVDALIRQCPDHCWPAISWLKQLVKSEPAI